MHVYCSKASVVFHGLYIEAIEEAVVQLAQVKLVYIIICKFTWPCVSVFSGA